MKNYFAFTRSQQIGVVVWTIIILIMIVLLNVNFQKNHSNPFEVSESDMSYVQLNAQKETEKYSYEHQSGWQKEEVVLFDFDPNLISISEWKELGFSEKQSKVIIDYKINRGPFKSKEDLKKVFVISEEKYKELEPHILLPNNVAEEKNEMQIELNSATQEVLETLPLIGPGFAKNIIKLRNSLGGFTSITQLHEVYNMNEEIYQILVESTTLDLSSIKTININSDSKETIDKHPYITWEMTAQILKKRDQEKINDLNFLVEKNLLSDSELKRLEPYIIYQ